MHPSPCISSRDIFARNTTLAMESIRAIVDTSPFCTTTIVRGGGAGGVIKHGEGGAGGVTKHGGRGEKAVHGSLHDLSLFESPPECTLFSSYYVNNCISLLALLNWQLCILCF